MRLVVGTSADTSDPIYWTVDAAHGEVNQRVEAFTMPVLSPDTRYVYAIEADGRMDLSREGQFSTFPNEMCAYGVERTDFRPDPRSRVTLLFECL